MRLPALAAAAAVAAAVLAGCGAHPHAAPPPPAPTTTTPTPRPSATPTPPATLSPLTGLRVAALGPVVGVKVDNVGSFGQNGLNAADVVYCEEVEGGLTRLLAIFSSSLPTAVGPVRSGRQSDLELLGEYGRIAMAFSGANVAVAEQFRAANLVDDSYDDVTGAYHFDTDRPKPYQFLVDVRSLAQQHPGVDAKDVGFRFGAVPPGASGPATSFSVHYPDTTISGATSGPGYAIARVGRTLSTDGVPVTATNVLLQYVSVHSTGYTDHNGDATPYSQTVGSGRAVLLRGGHAYPGTWSRTRAAAPTTWAAAGGGALRLAPGRTWVLLVPIGSVVILG